ncbi:MAG: hypothetical protein ACI3Z8_00445 [Paludibacteraceae bacterium]
MIEWEEGGRKGEGREGGRKGEGRGREGGREREGRGGKEKKRKEKERGKGGGDPLNLPKSTPKIKDFSNDIHVDPAIQNLVMSPLRGLHCG